MRHRHVALSLRNARHATDDRQLGVAQELIPDGRYRERCRHGHTRWWLFALLFPTLSNF
jgi:hypothetical protein